MRLGCPSFHDIDNLWASHVTRAASAGVQRLSALLAGAGGVLSVFALTACAPMMSLTGFSGSAVQFVATQIDRITLLANGVSYAQTGKTFSDRALSNVAS